MRIVTFDICFRDKKMNISLRNQIKASYDLVLNTIEKYSHHHDSGSNPVRLVVVTKKHSIDTIYAAIDAGIREFGENYAEEAVEKINAIGRVKGLTWHMIGHIQSRKADLVAKHFDFVHSVDSFKLATRLERFASKNNRVLPVLLECNVSGEESKNGFPAFEKNYWTALFPEVEMISQLPHLELRGLMTMPPLYDEPENTRPSFKMLHLLRDYLAERITHVNWSELSMGTSSDYKIALEEGATLIRVGSAIMGPRPSSVQSL